MKATESKQSNSLGGTSEEKLQSSEGGGGKIISKAVENENILEIKEEGEMKMKTKMKMKMVDDEPKLPLEISCTHSKENNNLISKGVENNTLNMISEITPKINESILASQGMENIIGMI